MNWNQLTDISHLSEAHKESFTKPIVIYKHSTRCGTSAMALSRLERSWEGVNAQPYFLDLIRYRDISNKISNDYQVYHESPQILLIIKGECIYDESHFGINTDELKEQIASQHI